MPFTIHLTTDYDQMSEVAAGIVEPAIAAKQAAGEQFVLGLATGSSPIGLYGRLAEAFNSGRLDARQVRSFNLDEYVGLPGENAQQRTTHPESYSFFMIAQLFSKLDTRLADADVPWATLIDEAQLEAALATGVGYELLGSDKGHSVAISPDADGYLGWVRREILEGYQHRIEAAGGIDLHVIGVGGRGHVAFHESGIPFEGSNVLLVQLDDSTINNAVADGHFQSAEQTPHFAVSMGAELTFRARHVVVLANGPRKIQPIAEAVLGEVSTDVPLSYVHRYVAAGGTVEFVIDTEAAVGLLDRLDEVSARGIVVVDHRDEIG